MHLGAGTRKAVSVTNLPVSPASLVVCLPNSRGSTAIQKVAMAITAVAIAAIAVRSAPFMDVAAGDRRAWLTSITTGTLGGTYSFRIWAPRFHCH